MEWFKGKSGNQGFLTTYSPQVRSPDYNKGATPSSPSSSSSFVFSSSSLAALAALAPILAALDAAECA
jgi:hypothetical protein